MATLFLFTKICASQNSHFKNTPDTSCVCISLRNQRCQPMHPARRTLKHCPRPAPGWFRKVDFMNEMTVCRNWLNLHLICLSPPILGQRMHVPRGWFLFGVFGISTLETRHWEQEGGLRLFSRTRGRRSCNRDGFCTLNRGLCPQQSSLPCSWNGFTCTLTTER